MVELPDDLIEQARTDLALACLSGPSDVQAARFAEFERLIAARVRAEAQPGGDPEIAAGRDEFVRRVRAEAEQRLAAVVVQVIDPETAAAETVTWGDALRMLTAWLGADGWTPSERRVRAQAVAEERQRATGEIRQARIEQAAAFGSEATPYEVGRLDGLEDAARIVAAGSVPEPTVEIDGVVMTQRQFDAARFPLIHGGAIPVISADEMSVAFGPVATPTEPAVRVQIAGEIRARANEAAVEPADRRLPAAIAEASAAGRVDGLLEAARIAERSSAASPVPAEQPPTCNCADFPGLAGAHSPWCGQTTGPRFSITGALPPAEQPEER